MTEYEFKDGEWNSGTPLTAAVQLIEKKKDMTFATCQQPSSRLGIREIFEKNKHLQIKFEDETWYSPNSNSGAESSRTISEGGSEEQELSEIWKQQKIGSWIWSEDKKSKTGILGGLDFSFKFEQASDLRPLQMLVKCYQNYFPGKRDLTYLGQKK